MTTKNKIVFEIGDLVGIDNNPLNMWVITGIQDYLGMHLYSVLKFPDFNIGDAEFKYQNMCGYSFVRHLTDDEKLLITERLIKLDDG